MFKALFWLTFLCSMEPAQASVRLEFWPPIGQSELTLQTRPNQLSRLEVIEFEKDPVLFAQLNQTLETLMTTPSGLSICRQILKSDPKLLVQHMGMSYESALRVTSRCLESHSSSDLVINSDSREINKFTLQPTARHRRYILVVTDSESLPFDSWTEPFSNVTSLVVSRSVLNSNTYVTFLSRLLAHETAVYFDSKSWPGSREWSEIPYFAPFRFTGGSSERLQAAMLNPLIFHALTSIRAFRVEERWISEVMKDPLDYENRDADLNSGIFGRPDCLSSCLRPIMQRLTDKMSPFALALMVLSPNYLSLKRAEIASRPLDSIELQTMSRAFSKYASSFRNQTNIQAEPFLNLFSPLMNQAMWETQRQVQELFIRSLVPEDMNLLFTATVEANGKSQPLIEFLAIPALSGHNIKFSQGPRPRIRSGGTL